MHRFISLLFVGLFCFCFFIKSAEAEIVRDVAYGEHARHKMDVYASESLSEKKPIIVMVHGGAWLVGDKAQGSVVRHKSAYFLDKGYLFVSVNYRFVPEVTPYEQAGDIAKAVSFLQKHASRWGGDPSRIILMGHSAGAHLVALLTADPMDEKWGELQPWRGSVLLDSGALDLVSIMTHPHLPFYNRAFGKDDVFWRLVSPFDRLSKDALPMMVVCSLPRGDSPCTEAKNFVQKANSLGVRASLLRENLSHRQINDQLGVLGDYTLQVGAFIDDLLMF